MDNITEGEGRSITQKQNPAKRLTRRELLGRLKADKLKEETRLEASSLPIPDLIRPAIPSQPTENASSDSQSALRNQIPRRTVVKGLAVATAAILSGGIGWAIKNAMNQSRPQENAALVPTPNVDQARIPQTDVLQIPEYLKEDYKLLNECLNLPPNYPEGVNPSPRQIKEKNYVERCLASDSDAKKKLERIDRGLIVVADYRLRIKLIEERWKLRQEGQAGLRKLTDEEIDWCASQNNEGTTLGIHPEVLAICTDGSFQTHELLLKLQAEKRDKFLKYLRPDLYLMKEKGELPVELAARLDNLNIDELLMNPGGMAELVCRETDPKIPPDKDKNGKIIKRYYRYGIAHIGHTAAKPQLKTNAQKETEANKKEREIQESSLTALIGKISEDTKVQIGPNEFIQLAYNEDRVAGSIAGTGDIRAGAVGFQFMPFTALTEYQFNKESFGIGFNPFGLEAIVGAYVMLARGTISVNQTTGQKAYEKFGYLRGTYPRKGKTELGGSLREDAIAKWNNHAYEITKVLEAANNYYDEITEKGVYQRKIIPMYKGKPLVFTPLYNQKQAA